MKRIFRKVKKYIKYIVIALFLFISYVGIFTYMKIQENDIKGTFELQLEEEREKNDNLEQLVYIPTVDIEKNVVLDAENFTTMNIKTDMSIEEFITKDDFGKVSKVDLKMGYPVYRSMVYDEVLEDTQRVEEFNMLLLQSNLVENDFIDVRVFFPNGENYIVLSKKKVEKLDIENNTVWLKLNETEINFISSAIVDAYVTGAKLYTNTYVESNIQEKSIPTYVVNESVLSAINKNPNILTEIKIGLELEGEKRELFNSRLGLMSEEDIQKVQDQNLTEKQLRDEMVKSNIEKALLNSQNIENEESEESNN